MYLYFVHTFIGNYYCGVGLIVIWLHVCISKCCLLSCAWTKNVINCCIVGNFGGGLIMANLRMLNYACPPIRQINAFYVVWFKIVIHGFK